MAIAFRALLQRLLLVTLLTAPLCQCEIHSPSPPSPSPGASDLLLTPAPPSSYGVSTMAVKGLAFTSDGGHLIAGHDTTYAFLYESETGAVVRELGPHAGLIVGAAISPDNRTVATLAMTENLLRFWDMATGVLQTSIALPSSKILLQDSALAYSPDGTIIAVGWFGGITTYATAPDGATTASGTEMSNFEKAHQNAKNIRFAKHTGEMIVQWLDVVDVFEAAASSTNGTGPLSVRWSVPVPDSSWSFNAMDVSQSGKEIALGYMGMGTTANDIRIYVYDGTEMPDFSFSLSGHTMAVSHVAWTHQDNALVSASVDGTLRVWRVSERAESKRIDLGASALVEQVAVSNAGLVAICFLGEAKLYTVWTSAECRPSGAGTMLGVESCSKAAFIAKGCVETACGQLQCPGSFEREARAMCSHIDQYKVSR